VPARPDSARAAADSAARADSLADTLQAPIARGEAAGIEPRYWWSRDALFMSGAQTLAELLSVIPGVTSFRSGWISSPAAIAYLGDPSRVRVFYDGLEFEPLDPRNGDILDLVEVPLWSVEEVRVERAADELRVHLRSWRVRTTTAVTRTDVYTGDEDTNLYRGFYGRRFRNGLAIQLAGEQYSTSSRRTTDAGDAISVFGRIGWSMGRVSVDGVVLRNSRTRDPQSRVETTGGTPVPALDARRLDAYARLAYGDPDDGVWGQALAASQAFREQTPGTGTLPPPGQPLIDPDSSRSMAQYVFTGGVTRGPFRFSVTDRLEVRESERFNGQTARLGLQHGWSSLSVFGERAPADSTMRAGVEGRLGVTSYLWLGGAASQRWDDEERAGALDVLSYRGEIGTRLGALWVTGGVLARDSTVVRSLEVLDTAFAPRGDGAAFGQFATLRGQVWKDVFIDAMGVRWDADGPYRPQWQSRAQLYLSTRWLRKFPSGNFGFMAAVTHEYRSDVCFPLNNGTCDVAVGHRVWGAKLELRIVSAVLTFQLDNPQLAVFERVPGFQMARGVGYYGVRWEFYN
jgi:hypothetical protein